MSVVNDVLKNLNQRQAMHGQNDNTAYFLNDRPDHTKWLWLGLSSSVLLCISLILIITFDLGPSRSEILNPYVPLPDSLFISSGPLLEKSKNIDSDSDLEAANKINKTKPKNSQGNTIVQRNSVSKATETVVSAINSGDIDGAKSKLSQASQQIQNEVQLRLLLKDNPVAVFQEIKRQYPDFSSRPILLALAAQGQQRSGDHESAVDLYKRLIPLEPNESRWRTGLAISLETLGDKKSAERLYKLALSMGNLPYSLKRFSENRLEGIQN